MKYNQNTIKIQSKYKQNIEITTIYSAHNLIITIIIIKYNIMETKYNALNESLLENVFLFNNNNYNKVNNHNKNKIIEHVGHIKSCIQKISSTKIFGRFKHIENY